MSTGRFKTDPEGGGLNHLEILNPDHLVSKDSRRDAGEISK